MEIIILALLAPVWSMLILGAVLALWIFSKE